MLDMRFFRLFLIPFRKVLLEIAVFTLLHSLLLFSLGFIFQSQHLAVIGGFWMIIISWRCGIGGAFMGIIAISLGTAISFQLHPDFEMVTSPKWAIFGIVFQFTLGAIFGFISGIVASLKKEIEIRSSIQKDLEQRNKELHTFGHTVAHDLKNPLAVLMMSEISLSNRLANDTDPKVATYLKHIHGSARKMANVIEEILELAGLNKNLNFPSDRQGPQKQAQA